MGLADRLGQRAALRGRSAPVTCGGLGTLTVEALPVRELELLLRGPDGARAVFYAACRELQQVGEELRKAGKVFTPDGVMQFVSGQETQAALQTVLELSGQSEETLRLSLPDTASVSLAEENRHEIVQLDKAPERAEIPAQPEENRLASVQNSGGAEADGAPPSGEFRLEPVQKTDAPAPGFGQVSRETGPLTAEFDRIPKPDKKTQAMGILAFERTQNVVTGPDSELLSGSREDAPETALHESKSEIQEEGPEPLHEIMSEFRKTPHEITSDFPSVAERTVHETTSEFREAAHETTSDFPALTEGRAHETTSELREAVHETKSDFPALTEGTAHETTSELSESLHEVTSESDENRREAVHETTSELAERTARLLLEGLRRAKWVRGD